MPDMLDLSAHLPEVHVDAGHVVVREGDTDRAIWVLVSGALEVLKGSVVVNTVTRPGALLGEVSVLLGKPYGATVRATAPSVLRHAIDGDALLNHHPAVARLMAVGLAERLNFVTAYLVDLKQQYGNAPGLDMVTDVLRQLSTQQSAPMRPGSARDPDPDY
jgi:CRP-like cAMP-binding protein